MEKITGKNNEIIKGVKKLFTSSKERRAQGLFVLEGARLVFDVLNSFYEVEIFLITESANERYFEKSVLMQRKSKASYFISDTLSQKLSETKNSQGIFAVCKMKNDNNVLQNGKKYIADQAQMILDLFPDTKKVGALYCSAEANSQYQVDGVKEALEKKGVSCTFYSFADSNDIATVAKKAASESDVIYVPTDNTAADNGSVIDAACKAANTPIIAGEEGIFKSTNAVATLSISFYNLGQKAGAMAYEILTKGTDPATMNVQQSDELTYYYNEEQAKAFKANVPDNYEAYNFSDAK